MLNIADLLDKFKIPIGIGLVGLVLIIGGLATGGSVTKPKTQEFPKESLVQSQKLIAIDVSGAVVTPGVYKLAEDGRVEDAIKAAGGLSEKANEGYVSKSLNMAQKLSDGVKIYIPFEGERVSAQVITGVAAGANASSGVSINSSTQAELEGLPGIGPVTASKIISGRPYQKVEDLLGQKIVPKATFEKIKDSLAL
jgi:competence protein ComEA